MADTSAMTGSEASGEVDPAVLEAAEAMLVDEDDDEEDKDDNSDEEDGYDEETGEEEDGQEGMASNSGSQAVTTLTTPFALTSEHEFPDQQARTPPSNGQTSPSNRAGSPSSPSSADVLPPPPALPGTPASPFRRCPCLAVLPGRVCQFCFSSRWTKRCPKCDGEGRLRLSLRQGAERSQPCGNCMGRGTLPATPGEIKKAEEDALAAVAGADGQSVIIALPAPEYRRAVKLPGIGVTSHKKQGKTKTARAAAAGRNEARKQRYAAGREK